MTAAAALLATALFVAALRAVRLVPATLEAVALARGTAGALAGAALPDAEKERLARRTSFQLLGRFASLAARLAGALAAPALLLLLLDAAGAAPFPEVAALLADPRLLAAAAITFAVFAGARRVRRRRPRSERSEQPE